MRAESRHPRGQDSEADRPAWPWGPGRIGVLDGGLATELEARGHELDRLLWSARLLDSCPDAIRQVHRSYLEAGADCLLGASYQASPVGLADCGYGPDAVRRLLERSVALAREERDAFVGALDPSSDRALPRVAASIGPYGAYLADGSEYRGRYGLGPALLRGFHRDRLHQLWEAGPDFLAIETLPCAQELRVLLELLDRLPGVRAWISFSCRDGRHISDGTPIRECAALCRSVEGVLAVGVNCTSPAHVPSAIVELRRGAPGLGIVVYPNSGERWDGERRCWTGTSDPVDFGAAAVGWKKLGASLVGGCCRTGPSHVREIRRAFQADSAAEESSAPGSGSRGTGPTGLAAVGG